MKRTLIAVALAMLAVSAGAQIYNPDNDSQTFFANNVPTVASPQAPTGEPSVGTVSPDEHYVYTGGERGWDVRPHSYTFRQVRLVHTADCLSMDEPKPQLTSADYRAMQLAERAGGNR